MAPLAATLAATAAIGLGVVLARAGSERIARARRGRRARLGLRAGESLAEGLRRQAIEQAEFAIGELDRAEESDPRPAVHEARKAIKRLRTIVRLLEGELGRRGCAREQDALRAAAALLASARDAEVMLDTFDALIARDPKKLAGRAGVRRLRTLLDQERKDAERLMLEPANRLRVSDELRLFGSRAASWALSEGTGLGPVEQGLHRIYGQGRKRGRRAGRKRGGRTRTMHQWRKRVKDLRYSAEAIQPAVTLASKSGPREKRAQADARWLRRLARRADELGEVLGEEHDLAVLAEWLETPAAHRAAKRRTRRALEKRIARRRAKLRRRALRRAPKLYAQKPGRFLARAAKARRRSAVALSSR